MGAPSSLRKRADAPARYLLFPSAGERMVGDLSSAHVAERWRATMVVVRGRPRQRGDRSRDHHPEGGGYPDGIHHPVRRNRVRRGAGDHLALVLPDRPWRLAGPVVALARGSAAVMYLLRRWPGWQLAAADSGVYVVLALCARRCVPALMRSDSSNWLCVVTVAPAWFAPTAMLAVRCSFTHWHADEVSGQEDDDRPGNREAISRPGPGEIFARGACSAIEIGAVLSSRRGRAPPPTPIATNPPRGEGDRTYPSSTLKLLRA